MKPEFWQYELLTRWRDASGSHDEPFCIGERIKKGTFRPCLTEAIPCSSIVGALRARLGIGYDRELIAVGYIDRFDRTDYAVTAPSDVALGTVKAPAPITVQFLTGVVGRVFVDVSDEAVRDDLEREGREFEISIGALKSTGYGRCLLRRLPDAVHVDMIEGKLRSRIPEKLKDRFGIAEVTKPIYGYLFEPIDSVTGSYVRALYEGSFVQGYRFLVEGK